MDLQKYLKEKYPDRLAQAGMEIEPEQAPQPEYSMEGLADTRAEVGRENALTGLMGAANKWVGGDGGVAQSQIDSNSQKVNDYLMGLKGANAKAALSEGREYNEGVKAEGREYDAAKQADSRAYGEEQKAGERSYNDGRDEWERKNRLQDTEIANAYKSSEADKDRVSKAEIKGMGGGSKGSYTPGQKKYQADMGKMLTDWDASGRSVAEASITKLEDVVRQAEAGKISTGGVLSHLPDGMRAVVDSDNMAAQQDVESVIQSSLKATLGAQFAQKEAEQLFARAWNPKLPLEYNLKRLPGVMNEIKNRQVFLNQASKELATTGWVGERPGGNQAPSTPSAPAQLEDMSDEELEQMMKEKGL